MEEGIVSESEKYLAERKRGLEEKRRRWANEQDLLFGSMYAYKALKMILLGYSKQNPSAEISFGKHGKELLEYVKHSLKVEVWLKILYKFFRKFI